MTARPDTQLSQELQELHLENKEWLSQLLFLEDEYRFFQQLFQNRYSIIATKHTEEEVSFVSNSLIVLKKQLNELKNLLSRHQKVLEILLKNENNVIGINFIEETSEITTQILALFAADKKVKKELFELVGSVK